VTTTRERRWAAGTLGLLAAALLVAGGLPWVTGGTWPVRLIALPLLLVGGFAAVTAARLPSMRLPHRSAPPVRRPHHCTRCAANAAAPTPADAPGAAGGSHRPD
jgi:hypothetical protein